MALYFEPKDERVGIGSSLAQGLGSALGGLVEGKIGSLQQQSLEKSLANLIKPEYAKAIAGISNPQLQQLALKEALSIPQRESYAQLASQLFGINPSAQGLSQGQIPSEQPSINQLNERQFNTLLQNKAQQETLDLKRQSAIQKENEPYLKDLRERFQPAKKINTLVNRALELVNNPDAQLGAIGSLRPSRFKNETTQEIESILNEIVTEKAQLGKGVPSRQRLLLEQLSKPQLWQKRNVINNRLNQLKDSAQKYIRENSIKDRLLEAGETKNLEQKTKRIKSISKKLLPAKQYETGSIVEENGEYFENINGQWQWIPKPEGE